MHRVHVFLSCACALGQFFPTPVLEYHQQHTILFCIPAVYHLQRYNKLSRNIRKLTQKICDLVEKDGFRAHSTGQLLEKLSLYGTGLIPTKQNLALTEKVTASSFCWWLPTIMVSLQMAQNLNMNYEYMRVGPEIVTDPAFLVTLNMDDFVTWIDSSQIKLHV
uniref:IMP U3 small nucleolar ribonucleoprotein 3 n=1 Tax=Hucho hucho TaxID=62062 RepID=A0A4W5MCU8_9TELE